ncbi:MAG: ABC transporter permease [Bacteroides sp.]|nr:ABC transporter permease [Bacteroides sp.]
MKIRNLILIAWTALMRNKTRALLTMLGIIIGISSVIAMVSIGESSTRGINNEISSMGTNMIMVIRNTEQQGGVNIGSENVQTMKVSDVEAISKEARYISMVTPSVATTGQLVYGSKNWPGTIQGGNEDYLNISKYTLASGSNFTPIDVRNAAKVCLVGQTVVSNLFPEGENPLGKIIRFGKIPFKVIGILEGKGKNVMGNDQDDIVIAPYTTVQRRLLSINFIHMIMASALSEEVTSLASSEIELIMRKQHKLRPGQENDFQVHAQQQLLDMMGSITSMLTILLVAVAGISLVVGGIGIMNIMYVTVTERTREIGLRRSVGAKNKDILKQFLYESTILSLIGGIIGMILGLSLAYLVAALLNWPFVVSVPTVCISFIVCAAIGMFFGWYPAKKAASLDPIIALRYE